MEKHKDLPQLQKVVVLNFATLFINEDKSILLAKYHKNSNIDIEEANELIEAVYPFIQAGAYYGITDATAKNINITSTARQIFKTNKSMQLSKYHAVVVKHLHIRLIAQMFIKLDKPAVKTKIFNDFQKAYHFLEEEKNQEVSSSKVPSV